MKASNVLQMLSENKELSVTRTPAAVQPVLDEEMAGCSQSYNLNISIKPAEVSSNLFLIKLVIKISFKNR